jgi:Glutathione S-transferase, N-terminal domain
LGTQIVKVSSSSAPTRIKLGDSMKPESITELIGMMDSPFVRRVAIALDAYGISYAHTPLSVYRNPELLAAINPLMTVPVLQYGGKQLIDSESESESETILNDATVAIATGYAFTREIAFALKIGLVSTSRLDHWCAGFERSLGENHIR